MTADKVIVKLNSFTGEFKNQQILSYLRKIDPYVFEELILSAFALKGFSIIRNKSYSGDGGLDGTVFKKDARFLVQAKRYTNWVKTSHIKDFETLISNQKANGGYFIHTGYSAAKVATIPTQSTPPIPLQRSPRFRWKVSHFTPDLTLLMD